eukprot:431086-Prymnesium_polylepis.2
MFLEARHRRSERARAPVRVCLSARTPGHDAEVLKLLRQRVRPCAAVRRAGRGRAHADGMAENPHAAGGTRREPVARTRPVDVSGLQTGAVGPHPSSSCAPVALAGGHERALVQRGKVQRDEERAERVAQARQTPLVHDDGRRLITRAMVERGQVGEGRAAGIGRVAVHLCGSAVAESAVLVSRRSPSFRQSWMNGGRCKGVVLPAYSAMKPSG